MLVYVDLHRHQVIESPQQPSCWQELAGAGRNLQIVDLFYGL
jgi:hypothetical protein